MYYDGTIDNGKFIPGKTPSYWGIDVNIGSPYLDMTDEEYELKMFGILFKLFDTDGSGCLSKKEMYEYIQWGKQDVGVYEGYAT